MSYARRKKKLGLILSGICGSAVSSLFLFIAFACTVVKMDSLWPVLKTKSEEEDDFLAELTSLVLKNRGEASSTKSSGFMHKVPKELGDVNKKAYEPEVVSIGPYYHYYKNDVQKMEEVKRSCMQSLFKRKPNVRLKDYYFSIKPMEQSARNCYEYISLDEYQLIAMLVLDGCFIIEVITEPTGQGNATYMPSRLRSSLQRDMLLLENQIPFFVLCKLFDIIHEPDKCSLLMKRVLLFFKCIFPGGVLYKDTLERKPEEVKHILDLIHFNWCPPKFSPIQPTSSASNTTNTTDDIIASPLTIPSASKLKEANVKFTFFKSSKPEEDRVFLESTNLFDVKFEDGKLVLPRLVVNGGTESLLRNLIAYEKMLQIDEHTPITDYALLLDSLINDETDVQILSKYGIIHNMLGGDEVVANFANQLTNNTIYYSDKFRYSDIFRRINSYYDKKIRVVRWNRAMSEFRENYFNSPWSFIAVVAATVLLLLTVAQTIFAAQDHFKRP